MSSLVRLCRLPKQEFKIQTTIETIETTFVTIYFCVKAKPVVSIVSIVVLIICLAMQISYKRVKTCYKIKIDFRDFRSRFRAFLPSAKPPGQSKTKPPPSYRAPFTVLNFLSCTPIVALSGCDSATIAPLNSHFNIPMIYVRHPPTA